MKQHWTKFELENSWTLSPGDLNYLAKKDNRLIYALKMKYFDLQGYPPKQIDDIPVVAIDHVAAQLQTSRQNCKNYNWQSRISQIHNVEIREYYGFKKLEQSDYELLKEFIEKDLLPQGLSISQVQDEVYKFLKKNKIEPSAQTELSKYINNFCIQYEKAFFGKCSEQLSLGNKQKLLELLAMYDQDQTVLNFLRTPTGKVSTITISEEQEKLSYLVGTSVVYQEFFNNAPRKFLKVHHDQVAISTPSRLLEIKARDQNKFFGLPLHILCMFLKL